MVRAASGEAGRTRASSGFAGVESMADDTREGDDHGRRQVDEAALSARLANLGKRLDASGAGRAPGADGIDRGPANSSVFARGFRLSTEFVAAVVAGAALGWLVDHWLRTSPWGLILCTLLGFAAGVVSLISASSRGSGSPSSGRSNGRQE